jgi:ribosomal protein S14
VKYLAFSSKKNINNILKTEILRHRLLVLRRFYSLNLNLDMMFKVQYLLDKLKHTNKLRFRCVLHNSSKSYRLFRVSRFALKKEFSNGFVVGVKKSS